MTEPKFGDVFKWLGADSAAPDSPLLVMYIAPRKNPASLFAWYGIEIDAAHIKDYAGGETLPHWVPYNDAEWEPLGG